MAELHSTGTTVIKNNCNEKIYLTTYFLPFTIYIPFARPS